MWTVSIILLVILALLIAEVRNLNRSVRDIRTRIHVNGTRGKSTVTEYIAAAIQENGSPTMAKITGVAPTLIQNGSKKSIRRRGGARIQEQFKIINEAAKKDYSNLVLECMSLDPALQRTESRFFRPHIYVITNIRDDHREIMGSTEEQQFQAICQAIPPNCTVVTGQEHMLEVIARAASEKNSRLVAADHALLEKVKGRIPSEVFPVNLVIALTVSRLLHIDPDAAFERILSNIRKQAPRLSYLDHEKDILVLNGFDVNDTESAERFLGHWSSEIGEKRKMIALFNTRADRPYRTLQFAEWLAGISGLAFVFISGNHRQRAFRALKTAGLDPGMMIPVKGTDIKNLRKKILALDEERSLVLTIGNIGGDGFKILNAII